MSLHVLANHMASKGRDGDSMLVHMTPGEVHGLQALAMKHGGSLTTNPDTGLPEAGALSKLLPTLIGIALAPATGGASLGITEAWQTAALVGGVQTLATGSLKKGLMAGLGAYGGAGLAGGFAGAGADAMTRQALSVEGALPSLENIAQVTGEGYGGSAANYSDQVNSAVKAARDASSALPTSDLMSAGAKAAAADPMGFAKQNLGSIAAIAAPILADQMVPTTTKAPIPTNPGNIVEQRWDGRQFVPVARTNANVFNTSNRNFSDLYRGYKDGGGIVALADGGPPTALTDEQLFQKTGSWEAAAAARDAQNNALNQYNWQQQAAQQAPAAQIQAAPPAAQAQTQAAAPTPVTPNADNWWASQPGGLDAMYSTINQQIAANPNMTDAQVDAAMKQYGISSQDVHNALQKGGGSQAEEWSLGSGNLGLSGLNTNITSWLAKAKADPNFAMLPAQQKQDAARAAMNSVNMNEADVVRATGRTIAELFPKTITVTPTGLYGDYGNNTGNPATSTPGDIGMNPDGTVTVTPNIPGRPQGGFTGMGQVVDTYTKGGGRTGYIPYAPKTIDEFNTKYVDRMSGDSRAAYDYLSGKAGAAYPTKSTVGQISRPYDEAVLGYPARGNLPYTYNKATGKMDVNPDYVAPGRDAKGNVTYGMSLNDVKKSLSDSPLQGQALYDWAMANNLSAQQIADATGQSLSQVYAQFRTGAQAKTAADKTAADLAASSGNTSSESSSGTGGFARGGVSHPFYSKATGKFNFQPPQVYSGGGLGTLGGYSDGGRLLKGPGDGVSDSIPATIGQKQQPARLADGEFVVPARIVSELGNGSTDAGAKKLYAMMDRVQRARGKTTGKNKVAANSRADKYLPA